MSDTFGVCEIIEMGIEIEKNGRDFYKSLAAKTRDLVLAELFTYLGKEEEKHIAAFNSLRETVRGCDEEHTSDEYFAYMNALSRRHVFTQSGQGSNVAQKITTDQDALDMALSFETDSIVFFEGMKDVVPPSRQQILQELIAQEKKHVVRLNEMKKGVSDGKDS